MNRGKQIVVQKYQGEIGPGVAALQSLPFQFIQKWWTKVLDNNINIIFEILKPFYVIWFEFQCKIVWFNDDPMRLSKLHFKFL